MQMVCFRCYNLSHRFRLLLGGLGFDLVAFLLSSFQSCLQNKVERDRIVLLLSKRLMLMDTAFVFCTLRFMMCIVAKRERFI